ncbi:MAG: Tim44/TimA family putative adaptor protein [Alphaproteobacteria bacterium]|nr:Tim44/TimA family putative adaptor protein [Alphaproteobacteria bacterium]
MVSFVDIIFLAILAVFVISRLYGAFGSQPEKKVKVIIKQVDKDTEAKIVEDLTQIIRESNKENDIDNIADFENLSEQDKILHKMNGFNKENFLHSACRVFEMVLQAFNSGNIENIKGLVSKKIWNTFNQVLNFRKENNITSEVDFICFKKSEIKDVKLLKNSVKITVEFESEQINLLKDAAGHIIEGDENFVQKITDVWTFERLFNAKNKNWTLVSTKKGA